MHAGEGRGIRSSFALTAAVIGCLLVPAVAVAKDPTTTEVLCTPPSILVGAATSCSATVQDTTPDGSTPRGTLEFSSDTPGGTFHDPDHPATPATSCELSGVGEGEPAADCRLLYVPGTFGTGVHKISVSYPESEDHDSSGGFATVNVAKHSSAMGIACAPASIMLGAGTSACVVTVTDTSAVASTPSGGVALSSASGGFDAGCGAISAAGTGQASCMVTFTPFVSGLGSLSGTYGGDGSHETSTATTQMSIAPSSKSSRGAKKKCKKKHRAAAAKKKCKKKKKKR